MTYPDWREMAAQYDEREAAAGPTALSTEVSAIFRRAGAGGTSLYRDVMRALEDPAGPREHCPTCLYADTDRTYCDAEAAAGPHECSGPPDWDCPQCDKAGQS